jgi:hypothetical protein
MLFLGNVFLAKRSREPAMSQGSAVSRRKIWHLKSILRRDHPHRDLSTAFRSVEKQAATSRHSMIIRAIFIFLGGPKTHGNSGRDDKG